MHQLKAPQTLDGRFCLLQHEPKGPHASTTTDDPEFEKGKKNSHSLNGKLQFSYSCSACRLGTRIECVTHMSVCTDPKDQRSLEKRAQAEKELEGREEPKPLTGAAKARAEGKEPSKGARIDEEIENEEHEYLKRKGKI